MNNKVKYIKYAIINIILLSIICCIIIITTDNPKKTQTDTTTDTVTSTIVNEVDTTTIPATEPATEEKITEPELTSEPITKATTKQTAKQTTKQATMETNMSVTEVYKTTEETESADNDTAYISLGDFKLTAYCNCSTCCGQWAGGATASGAMPKSNHTIAADTSVIPFGTKVMINGVTYVVEDTGSAIKGNKIDIYMSNHQDALNFGVQYAEVFIIK